MSIPSYTCTFVYSRTFTCIYTHTNVHILYPHLDLYPHLHSSNVHAVCVIPVLLWCSWMCLQLQWLNLHLHAEDTWDTEHECRRLLLRRSFPRLWQPFCLSKSRALCFQHVAYCTFSGGRQVPNSRGSFQFNLISGLGSFGEWDWYPGVLHVLCMSGQRVGICFF